MPELPDIEVYLRALDERISGAPLTGILISHPFVLRTVEPSPQSAVGQHVCGLTRIGKRIAIGLGQASDAPPDVWFVIHLMIAGRLQWKEAGARPRGKQVLAMFDFPAGTLVLTEAGTQKRASLFVVADQAGLDELDPAGLEPLTCSRDQFRERLVLRNHTVKRALTDPTLFSGIGNAYSDEILHHAGQSPVTWTQRLSSEQVDRLYEAVVSVLNRFTSLLDADRNGAFPKKVTAFRPEMAVHGKFGEPCPVCGNPVQRIRFASNETNYCANCQTGGKLLADRSLSRLLGKDWPKTVEELEERRRGDT